MAYAAPAFSFYPADFVMATATFTNEEVGAYVRLLLHQWAVCRLIPGDDATAIARICGHVSARKMRKLWRVIGTKFQRNADGSFSNERIETERAKQLTRRELRQQAGAMGGRAKYANAASNARTADLAKSSLSFSTSLSISDRSTADAGRTPGLSGTSRGSVRARQKIARRFASRVELARHDGPTEPTAATIRADEAATIGRGPGADPVVATIGARDELYNRGPVAVGMESAHSRAADQGRLAFAAAVDASPSDGSSRAPAAAIPEPAAEPAAGAAHGPNAATTGRTGGDRVVGHSGPRPEDRERVQRLKERLGLHRAATLLAGIGAHRRPRAASGLGAAAAVVAVG